MTKKEDRPPHIRMPKTIEVSVKDVAVEPFEHDPQFHDLYQSYRKGKLRTALTRIHTSDITSGFYRYKNGQVEHVPRANLNDLPYMISEIRRGLRPVLVLYWNSLCPAPSKYVCADDEIALAAYRELQVGYVPCLILKPRETPASEASIWTQARFDEAGERVRLFRSVAPKIEKFGLLHFGNDRPAFTDMMKFLSLACAQVRQEVKQFHVGEPRTNYHHVLYAVLRRHERILDSIDRLVALKRIEHAAALVRVAYEAFLNFYIDWLSPGFFGPRLQFLAMLSRDSINKGKKPEDHPEVGVLENFVDFLTRTADKARVSPLGIDFHKWIYPSLSLVSHQSYENIQDEAHDFLDGDLPEDQAYVDHFTQCLNIITTALLLRIRNDVGTRT